MTTYEILLMLDPEGAETHQDELIARVRELVEKGGGTWRSHDAWGRRRLAYEIAKKPEGVYHLVVFEAPAETLDEVSRVLKIDDGVLRHLATRHIEGSRTSAPRDDAAAPERRRPSTGAANDTARSACGRSGPAVGAGAGARSGRDEEEPDEVPSEPPIGELGEEE